MNLKQEQQQLNNRLDKARRKLAAAELRRDQPIILQFQQEIERLNKQIHSVKAKLSNQVSDKGIAVKALPFKRALSKAEQADMGKLKKTVKGLVVVHPLTALGRELGVTEVTGFARKEF